MKIGTENIESLIFDYHEGNLSDSEKADVLSYIHDHPEYESEFTQWAQSYLPPDNSAKDYGLTNKLIHNQPTAWYNKSWVRITSIASIAMLFLLGYFIEQQPVNSKVNETSKTPPLPSNIQSSDAPEIHLNKKNTASPIAKKQLNISTQIHSVNSKQDQASPQNKASITETIDNKTDDSKLVISESTESSQDISAKNTVIEPKNETPKINNTNDKANKNRKSYSIKPTDKFIPTNPNF